MTKTYNKMLRPLKPTHKPLCNYKRQEQDDLALMAHTQLTMDEISNSNEYWIGDTGATTHITSIPEGIYNCASPDGTSQSRQEIILKGFSKINCYTNF